ncbi:MAG: maltose alpha-D-glucosyltransferase, partial [Anaerolineales bacterium]
VRCFHDSNGDGIGDFQGLLQKLDYIEALGVDAIWLQPVYPSPLRDDGYDIADYYDIHPDYGTLDDFRALVDAVHARGMRIITDLVLNHTSDQHPWFQAARADRSSPYRDYYVWSDAADEYSDARIIFLDSETSNWTWDEQAGQYYWHRFYASQPDLNFDNPAVRAEMIAIARFWLDLGVDGFRADAVPYLFEREGTNCENLPETHAYLQEVRRFMDAHYPDRVLLCEANQWPEDVRRYFGDPAAGRAEFHLGFHFPVMPRIFMALRKGVYADLKGILDRMPSIPDECQWCIFLRNHDELTLEMVTEDERQWMWQQYAPEERMRLNLGIRRRLAPLLDNDRRKIELANSLLFTLPGSPIAYYGDEIGMGDNLRLSDRNGVRTPMQWEAGLNAGFSVADRAALFAPIVAGDEYGPATVNAQAQQADPRSLYHSVRRMIAVRKRFAAFGSGDFQWKDSGNPAVAAYVRSLPGEDLLIVHNLSAAPQLAVILYTGHVAVRDILAGGGTFPLQSGRLELQLEPYQYLWLRAGG